MDFSFGVKAVSLYSIQVGEDGRAQQVEGSHIHHIT